MLKREDYKAVKRMDRQQMDAYLQRVYRRGFEAGAKAVLVKKPDTQKPIGPEVAETTNQ